MKDYTELAYVELGPNANLLECVNTLLKKLKIRNEPDDATKTDCWKTCLKGKKL